MAEIIFNNNSNEDFDLILTSFKPQPPSPKIIKSDVPFMNGSYDFSNLNGEQSYNERKIPCTLQYVANNRILSYIKYTKILEWLLGSGRAILKNSDEPGLYYVARVESAPTWDIVAVAGKFEFEFIAYPFKYGDREEGNDIWDDFNFETDYAQDIKFIVKDSLEVSLYNPSSKKIVPSVICDNDISIKKGGTTYKFKAGITRDYRFSLDKGQNSLTVQGNGSVEFAFRKEVL
jgi:phage-related protein